MSSAQSVLAAYKTEIETRIANSPSISDESYLIEILFKINAALQSIGADGSLDLSVLPDVTEVPLVVSGVLGADNPLIVDCSQFTIGASVAFDIDVSNNEGESIQLAIEGRTRPEVDFRSYDAGGDTFTLAGNVQESAAASYPVAQYQLRLVSATGTPTINVSARAVRGGSLI